MYQHNSSLMGVVVSLSCLVLVCGQTHNLDRRSCGIRMCIQLCRRAVGCSGYGFSVLELVCFITDIAHSQTPSDMCWFDLSGTKGDAILTVSNMTCPNHSIIFQSKARGTVCAPIMPMEDIPKNNEQMKPRLMLAMRDENEVKFQAFDVNNSSFSPYQFINITSTLTALAYAPKAKKLMLSMRNPSEIVSSTLDEPGLTTIISRTADALAMDEGRHLVFFADQDRLNVLGRVTCNGSQLEYFDPIKNCGRVFSLTVDPNRELVYFPCVNHGLMSVSYQGENKQLLYKGKLGIGRSVCFDTIKDSLFFNSYKVVMKMSLHNNVYSEVVRLSFHPQYLQCYGMSIYVGSSDRYNQMGIISKSDGKYKVLNISGEMDDFIFTVTY